jgi:hypothetical protein
MLDSSISRTVKGLEYTTMSRLLADFRKQLERDLGARTDQIELNGALLLHDLCVYLKLGDKQRQEVLGRHGTAFVDTVLAASVTTPLHH